MIDVAGSLTTGTILVFVLLLWRKASLAAQDLPMDLDVIPGELESCAQEFVARIFSREDSNFLDATQSKPLKELFLRERKSVALLWVRQNSKCIRSILREHTALARHSEDLHFQTELGIFLRYFHLRALCGFLFVAIALTGPFWIRGVALRADVLFQRFSHIRQSFKTVSAGSQRPTGDSI